MLRRRGAGLIDTTSSYIAEEFRHRVCVGWLDGVVKGGVHCISLYLKDSEGLSPTNMAILEEVGVALRCLRGP